MLYQLYHQPVFHDVQELAMQLSESRGTLQATWAEVDLQRERNVMRSCG